MTRKVCYKPLHGKLDEYATWILNKLNGWQLVLFEKKLIDMVIFSTYMNWDLKKKKKTGLICIRIVSQSLVYKQFFLLQPIT